MISLCVATGQQHAAFQAAWHPRAWPGTAALTHNPGKFGV
jgi:hypothetical protein